MDSTGTFDSNVDKQQETLYSPAENTEVTVQGKSDEVVEETDLEPHVLLLQKFLGKELAQQFLDPFYEVPANAIQPFFPEKTGQGAKDYWRLLRQHSETQLQQMMASEGTLTCSLFTKMPSSKCVDKIQDFRKTLRIMYRMSKINQEKAVLIMRNNPLPDFNEGQKNDSPMQYLCKDIIQTKNHFLLPSLKCTDGKEDGALATGIKTGNRNYRFVTEDAYKHFREGNRQFSKETYYSPRCTQPSGINAIESKSICSSITEHPVRGHTCEALTYTALMDSKPSITAPGQGYFRHGQPTRWFVSHTYHANTD